MKTAALFVTAKGMAPTTRAAMGATENLMLPPEEGLLVNAQKNSWVATDMETRT